MQIQAAQASPCSALGSLESTRGLKFLPTWIRVSTDAGGAQTWSKFPRSLCHTERFFVTVNPENMFRTNQRIRILVVVHQDSHTATAHIYIKDCRKLQGFSTRILFLDAFGALPFLQLKRVELT